MTWKFSDGTVAHLGGKIEGASLFAQELRAELATGEAGVAIWPPNDGLPLDTSDPALFDAWLRQELTRPYRKWMMVELLESPKDIPPLPTPPWEDVPNDQKPADLLH